MAKGKHATAPGPNEYRGRMTEAQLRAADRIVGSQVRFRRISLGLSQQAVSDIMGLTFQQLQKYEHGTNRISGSRLYQLAQILHVPVSFFFEPIDQELGLGARTADAKDPEMPSGLMNKKKTIDLVRAFYAIRNVNEREAAFRLIATLGSGTGSGAEG